MSSKWSQKKQALRSGDKYEFTSSAVKILKSLSLWLGTYTCVYIFLRDDLYKTSTSNTDPEN